MSVPPPAAAAAAAVADTNTNKPDTPAPKEEDSFHPRCLSLDLKLLQRLEGEDAAAVPGTLTS